MLLDLALRQFLSAISLSLGLEAPDTLDPDTLLRRVPTDHPLSELAGRLADTRSRDASMVEHLVAALSVPDTGLPGPEKEKVRMPAARRTPPGSLSASDGEHTDVPVPTGPAAAAAGSTLVPAVVDAGGGGPEWKATRRNRNNRTGTGESTDRDGPDADGARTAAERSGAVPFVGAGTGGTVATLADGPTAFQEAARRARADHAVVAGTTDGPREASSAAFWLLMDRWAVSDADALALLGSERVLTTRNTRPRFRLRGAEAARFGMLLRIDTALDAQGESPGWLRRSRRTAPFGGRTPLGLLLDDADVAESVLHALNRAGLRASLTGS